MRMRFSVASGLNLRTDEQYTVTMSGLVITISKIVIMDYNFMLSTQLFVDSLCALYAYENNFMKQNV